MAYKTKFDGSTDKTIQVGGNKADGTPNPSFVEGYFLGSKVTTGDYGPGKLHVFQTKDGTVGVWGKSRLDKLLTTDLVGQMVLVSFTGMIEPTKKGRRPSYGYRLKHDKDNTTDVSDIDLNATSEEASESNEETIDYAENSLEDEGLADEVAPARPIPPRAAAPIPNASRVQALLSKNRTSAK